MDHEKSVVAVTKDLQLPQRMFHYEAVHNGKRSSASLAWIDKTVPLPAY
jgi:hypothetical protein